MKSLSIFACLSSLFIFNDITSALQFDVKPNTEKCLSDDVNKASLVAIAYNVLGNVHGLTGVSLLVKDPNGKYIKEDHNIDVSSNNFHSFKFTADEDGSFTCCFYNNNPETKRVFLDYKHGVEAKDYSDVAKKEHLMPVEKELRKMEDTVDEIHKEMLYMREREAAMRNTNESTNSRVLWFSFFSIAVLIGMGTWQVIYLKKFFRSKKLI